MKDQIILEMKHIDKIFPGVKALSDVSFDLKTGEIHALVGENGAGKSTLMKVLGGIYPPDAGEIYFDGKPTKFATAKESIDAGISIIYQEFNLVSTMTIAENIFLGKEIRKGKSFFIDYTAINQKATEAMASLGMNDLKGDMLVSELSVAQQQMVEIAKALYNNSKVLVMDEPTAVLTDKERDKLFDIILKLRDDGVAIIYISHRLEEIISIADRVTILRDGCRVEEIDNSQRDTDKKVLADKMVGRSMTAFFPPRTAEVGIEPVLEIEGFTKNGVFENISFVLKKCEILGFAGLVGAGRTEVMKGIFGAMETDGGIVKLEGKTLKIKAPREAIASGIAYLPEDRKAEGLMLKATMADNIALANTDKISTKGWINNERKRKLVAELFERFDIRPMLPDRMAGDFSGGNQQKAIIAKWIETNPKILILDEPTRGIDIGAKAEIYRLMNELTELGMSIIMVSSEMVELMGVCDRILVMYEGEITSTFTREQGYTQEDIMRACSGL